MTVRKKRIRKHDRTVDHENAMKGVAKWKRIPRGARRAERVRKMHGWGFEGRSPRTRKRKYKNKA